MGLFVQDIKLGLSSPDYVIEKVALPDIKKKKVDLYVAPGSVAILGSNVYEGQNEPYKLTDNLIPGKDVYLYPSSRAIDSITVKFFGGQHEVRLSAMKEAKAKFSIVGDASIEIDDYKTICDFFKKSLTKQDLADEINNNYRTHLSNEVSSYASKFIDDTVTEVVLQSKLDAIVDAVMVGSRKTSSMLYNMGLLISNRGISLHLNALDDADEKIQAINDALSKKAIDSLNDDERQREIDEKERERQFELDKIRAEHTTIAESENTQNTNTNVNTNGNGSVVINNNEHKDGGNRPKFCAECGKPIESSTAKFCPNCGAPIK